MARWSFDSVSIVVCTYNRADSLVDTLNSLAMLEIPGGIKTELLIIDNNSKDHTPEVVSGFSDHPLRIRYVFEKAQGLSFARNRALDEASGDVIVFTDDDVLPNSVWLKGIVQDFQSDDALGVVGGKILPDWKSKQPSWLGIDLYPYLALLDYGEERQILLDKPVWGANMAFATANLKQAGGFDTGIGRAGTKLYAGEETDVINTIRDNGKQVLYDPSLVVLHRVDLDRLKKRYFIKWVWDNGELDSTEDVSSLTDKSLLGVPRFQFGILYRHFIKILFASSNERFHRFLLFVRQLSCVWHSLSFYTKQ